MAWMIGIDEAGYGPNLGPLVVGATAWWVEEEKAEREKRKGQFYTALAPAATPVDLYRRLANVVSAAPDGERIAIADSKQLYKPGGGLRQLERGVLTALATVVRDDTTRWSELIAQTQADPEARRSDLPWYADFDCPLPIDAGAQEIAELKERFAAACGFADVKLVNVQARLVFPGQFNELTEYFGTKGAALSHISIGLLQETLDTLPTAHCPRPTAYVTCDKHGGRNRYAALLQHHFPEHWIETVDESRAASRYRFGDAEICFCTGGEAELPVALASMTAKYHRELAMKALNAFWCGKLPELRPTAGYPVDAKRFKAEIAALQYELGIDDALLWRKR
ncbi:MAG: hypothetical protein MI725_14490 [Pirellulales bacterium]|nr:hypothetical protein [Pirellulales bacterium]